MLLPLSSSPQALQKQLGSRLSSRNAVTKAGRLLMKHKSGGDKAVLKKKLTDLEEAWEQVCQVSVRRQDRLEEAHRLIGHFRSLSPSLPPSLPPPSLPPSLPPTLPPPPLNACVSVLKIIYCEQKDTKENSQCTPEDSSIPW